MRILVVEDERITRSSLVRQLERWGHEVDSAEDGEAGWNLFRAGGYDLVLTDWEMPRVSGLELIGRIRGVERPEYVYLIMLTSRSEKGDVVSGIEAGADDFLSKPFDREELRVRLLAGERVIRLERRLTAQNGELQRASERMRRDLDAAARVQRALLPKKGIAASRVSTAFVYTPTDELAGDALGFHLVDDRYLVAYVVDVSGHGVPAALLAVTAMHAMSPTGDAVSALRDKRDGAHRPSRAVSDLNRRFSASDNDGRFLTMVLCVLDVERGTLRFARAGHPFPLILRRGEFIRLSNEGGMPLAIMEEAEYEDVEILLEPGDRIFLYSDGFAEQLDPSRSEQFGEDRLRAMLISMRDRSGAEIMSAAIEALAEWAGTRRFADDVSLVGIDWAG